MLKKTVNNKTVIIDIEDEFFFNLYKWHINGNYVFTIFKIEGKQVKKYLHRLLLDEPVFKVVDHINGNPLDNRKENLRACWVGENIRNRKTINKNKRSSKYKGVYWHKKNKNWYVKIMLNKKSHNIGSFETEIEAAKAYDRAAKRLHKDFASLNFED